MSENLNRSTPDFSKYDSMSIGELEEILRADAMGSERDDSDVDEILYVMEVLAKKKRQNGIAGKTALEAYQEFQQHYLPIIDEENIESVSKRKGTIIPFRWIAAVAASLVLVFTLTTSANAFGWKDIWNAVARWAEETFSFSTGVEVSEPLPSDEYQYRELSDLFSQYKIDRRLMPTYFPDGFALQEILVDETPLQEVFLVIYSDDKSEIKISIKSFLTSRPEQIEMDTDFSEVYTVSGIDYYIFSNYNQCRAVWISDTYECYISGEISVDEIKGMIDSMKKG